MADKPSRYADTHWPYSSSKPRYAESRWSKGPVYIGAVGDPDSPGFGVGEGVSFDNDMFPEAVRKLRNQFPKRTEERMFIDTKLPQGRGSVYIHPDPEGTDADASRLFRHESVHNLLANTLNKENENQSLQQMRRWQATPGLKPYADQLKRKLKSEGAYGDPEGELPAYMFGGHLDVTPKLRQGYMREMVRLMQRNNPREAAILRRMAESVVGETSGK